MTYGNSPTDPSQGGAGPYGSGPYSGSTPQGGQQPYGSPQQPAYGAPGQQSYGSQPQYGAQPGGQALYGSRPADSSPTVPHPVDSRPPTDSSPYGGALYGGAPSSTTVVPGGPQAIGPDGEPMLSQPLYGATIMQATKRFFKKYARLRLRVAQRVLVVDARTEHHQPRPVDPAHDRLHRHHRQCRHL